MLICQDFNDETFKMAILEFKISEFIEKTIPMNKYLQFVQKFEYTSVDLTQMENFQKLNKILIEMDYAPDYDQSEER